MSKRQMRCGFILDCSMTMAWCFEDESTQATDEILQRLSQQAAKVPALWALEVMNMLLIAERKKRLTNQTACQFAQALKDLPIIIDAYIPLHTNDIVYDLARKYGLTIYDATYLALAKREKLPLATLDKLLIKAAKAAGIDTLPE